MRTSLRKHLVIAIVFVAFWALWMLGLIKEAPPLGSY
jgi:hypothetical protein